MLRRIKNPEGQKKNFVLLLWMRWKTMEGSEAHKWHDRSRCWWGPCSWFIDSIFLLCLHMVKGGRELSEVSFLKELIPFLRAPWPNDLSKAPLPTTITWRLEFQHMDFKGIQFRSEQYLSGVHCWSVLAVDFLKSGVWGWISFLNRNRAWGKDSC